ncbi:hypothetical protein [Legionella sp. CNM-4043-24]|uniref:hypothetical protein n=1 Tax=Legionella sp. CNM-4043-24 TaxID=3421646 RepID=UPI00403AEC51
MPVSLEQIRAWPDSDVADYFCHHNPGYSKAEAQQLFKDLRAWMWLSFRRRQQQKDTWLFGPLLELDKLWHAFILHTREYSAFCQTHFGQYFHHDIETIGAEHQQDPEELSDFLHDCYEYLGEDWVNRYFAEALA